MLRVSISKILLFTACFSLYFCRSLRVVNVGSGRIIRKSGFPISYYVQGEHYYKPEIETTANLLNALFACFVAFLLTIAICLLVNWLKLLAKALL